MNTVCDAVASGGSIADAVRATDGYFPSVFCQMVDVGEKTGRLDQTLLQLASHYEFLVKLRGFFLMGLIWPAFNFIGAMLVIGLLICVSGWLAPPGESIDLLGLGPVSYTHLTLPTTPYV